jgi:hypothetical protein
MAFKAINNIIRLNSIILTLLIYINIFAFTSFKSRDLISCDSTSLK